MIRTHDAGTLRAEQAGETVTLTGWVARRRDHGGVVFVDLRDASGFVQVVFREGDAAVAAHDLRAEYCVKVVGDVIRRPEGSDNPNLPTGEVEVVASELVVLSESAELPFPIDGGDEISSNVEERLRWKYRYLDLRRSGPARALRTRAKITSIMRRVMESHDFLDIETPYLTRSTPEGARDFLVPVRLQPGHWYALPQSPAAVQAAADGVGTRALLPDRAVLPRRGQPRRPYPGVHPARRRAELPRRGGHLLPDGGAARRAVVRDPRRRDRPAVRAPDLRGEHAPVRLGPPRPAVRSRAGRSARACSPRPRSASSSRCSVPAVTSAGS